MKKKYLIIPIIVVITITCYLCYQHFNRENIVFKNNAIKKENNMLSMMYETALGSGIYQEQITSNWPTSGYTFNEELSNCENGSELSWDNINKKVVVKSRVSDRCYVYFDIVPYYVYWNDNFENNGYEYNEIPETTYGQRSDLEVSYGINNFLESPIYIRSTKIGSTISGHEVCIYYNNNEFCLGPNYWVSDIQGEIDLSATITKLQNEAETALGIEAIECYEGQGAACTFDDFEIMTGDDVNNVVIITWSANGNACYSYNDDITGCE